MNPYSRRDFLRSAAIGTAGISLGATSAATDAATATGRAMAGGKWKIHLFSKHLQFIGYREMADTLAACGLDGADLTVRPGGHVLPENVERDLPLAARALREAGVELTMITSRITDPEDPLTKRILSVAAEQGIRYYRLGYYHYDPEMSTLENLDLFRRKMSGLARLNEKYGIHGAYQNHAGRYFGAPVWDLWEVLKDLDPRWMGCQYDIRHAVVEGADTWTWPLNLLKDHIRCMVIKDFRWREEGGQARVVNTPIGEGIVDFAAYFGQLERLGIKGPISLHMEYELFPDRSMPPGQKREFAVRAINRDLEALKDFLP